jgi:hypothetical protein
MNIVPPYDAKPHVRNRIPDSRRRRAVNPPLKAGKKSTPEKNE